MDIKKTFQEYCKQHNVTVEDDEKYGELYIYIPTGKMFNKTRSNWYFASYMGINKITIILRKIAYKKCIDVINSGIVDFVIGNPECNTYVVNNRFACYNCGGKNSFQKGKCIDCLIKEIPWKEGDKVKVKSIDKIGIVVYNYYNGYTLVNIGEKVNGGIFNNDATYKNDDIELVTI